MYLSNFKLSDLNLHQLITQQLSSNINQQYVEVSTIKSPCYISNLVTNSLSKQPKRENQSQEEAHYANMSNYLYRKRRPLIVVCLLGK